MAADDWLAIPYLLKRPEAAIQAITVTGAGEAHCEPGVKNALGLVALGGHPGLPVACGRERPLQGNHIFPTAWRDGVDSLYGLTLPEDDNAASTQTAVELLTATVQSSPQKITLLTLGPLTNVAEALQATPTLKDNMEMIYMMGGAVDAPGNVGVSEAAIDNDFAEWNFYIDPHAAGIVFQSGAPLTLIPLDATNQAPVTVEFYNRLKDEHATPVAKFAFEALSENHGFIESGGFYFWDPLAAAILTDESLATFETRALTVVEDEGPRSGGLAISDSSPIIRFAASADGKQFEQVFLEALNR